jgi:hypothetical protein
VVNVETKNGGKPAGATRAVDDGEAVAEVPVRSSTPRPGQRPTRPQGGGGKRPPGKKKRR